MENPNTKLSKLLRGRPTEIPHSELNEFIAFALSVPYRPGMTLDEIIGRSPVQPSYPMLIVAANREVMNDQLDGGSLGGRRYKTLDTDNVTIHWNSDVHDFYRRFPESFAHDNPQLRLGATTEIGHATTFFVDPSMYRLLQRIPADERQADLRLMTTAGDIALAILASTSEPTYFPEVLEPEAQKLLIGDRPGEMGNSRERIYYGGYLMPVPAQDVRRVLPGLRVFGTGYRHNPTFARKLLINWMVADVEIVAQLNEWWIDAAAYPNEEFKSHMIVRDLRSPICLSKTHAMVRLEVSRHCVASRPC